MLKNKKILSVVIIVLILIIAGTCVLAIKGLNYGLNYGANTTIKIATDTKPEMNDILKEIFGRNYSLKQTSGLENNMQILVKSATNEQIDTLIKKFNEKFELSLTNDNLTIENNPKMNGNDLVFPYILPALIVSMLALIYFVIRYKKEGILNVILITVITIIGVQLVYLSIYAVFRIPVNEVTMPISMFIFALSFIGLSEVFEKKYTNIKEAQKKK